MPNYDLEWWERFLPSEEKRRRRHQRWMQDLEGSIRKARERGDKEKVHALRSRKEELQQRYWEQEQIRLTQDLMKQKRRLKVQSPPRTDESGEDTAFWQQSRMTGERYLTPAGVSKMREILREEEDWRMRRREHWASVAGNILPGLTGVIGAVIGLISVL